MTLSPRHQWPMDSYIAAWKTFRRLSDENRATAAHLLQREAWPVHDGLVMVDVGCGDGRLMEAILLQNPSKVAEVRLIDPDGELLDEATKCITETGHVRRITRVQGGLEETSEGDIAGTDLVLLIHVVYLVEPEAVQVLLYRIPADTPTFIVLDAPHSVFTTLWERTAPTYHQRAVASHRLVQNLSREEFEVTESIITSSICDPLALTRTDVRNALLSILCYRELSPQNDRELRAWIERTIRDRREGDVIRCESTCYQVTRRE